MQKESAWLLADLGGVGAVAFEDPSRSKFAEFVPDHVFRDVDSDEVLAIVNIEGVADEIGDDHAAAGPGLDRALDGLFVHFVHFDEKLLLNEGTFFK